MCNNTFWLNGSVTLGARSKNLSEVYGGTSPRKLKFSEIQMHSLLSPEVKQALAISRKNTSCRLCQQTEFELRIWRWIGVVKYSWRWGWHKTTQTASRLKRVLYNALLVYKGWTLFKARHSVGGLSSLFCWIWKTFPFIKRTQLKRGTVAIVQKVSEVGSSHKTWVSVQSSVFWNQMFGTVHFKEKKTIHEFLKRISYNPKFSESGC